MISISISIPTLQIEKIIKGLTKWSERETEEVDRRIWKIAKDIERDARELAPYDIGYLQANIRAEKLGIKQARITADAPYAAAQEFGYFLTQRQIAAMAAKRILKRDKVPKFWYPGAEKVWVQQPFMGPALQKNIPELEREIEDVLKQITEETK